jgi:hypothetical protein
MHAAPTIAPATSPATPTPQHMRALARANQVRLARAALKRAVARGEISVAELILDSPWEAESMTISELLRSQSRWGRKRARKFLSRLGLTENKPVGTLTQRQRRLLAAALEAKLARRNGSRELIAAA